MKSVMISLIHTHDLLEMVTEFSKSAECILNYNNSFCILLWGYIPKNNPALQLEIIPGNAQGTK